MSLAGCAILAAAALLSACSSKSASRPDGPAAPGEPVTVDASGGTVLGPGGASVIVPPGATQSPVTLQIGQDGSGAPALPAEVTPVARTLSITPHGATFDRPVVVRIPFDGAGVTPDQDVGVFKAEPGGSWSRIPAMMRGPGEMVVQVADFSFFTVGVVVPTVQLAPVTVEFVGETPPPPVIFVPRPHLISMRVSNVPNCPDGNRPQVAAIATAYWFPDWLEAGYAGYTRWAAATSVGADGTAIVRIANQWARYLVPPHDYSADYWTVGVELSCGGNTLLRAKPRFYHVDRSGPPERLGAGYIEDLVAPAGTRPTLRVAVLGGPMTGLFAFPYQLSDSDQYRLEWQWSHDSGTSWQTFASSYQRDAVADDSLSMFQVLWNAAAAPRVEAGDDGALFRAVACYTPPGGTQDCVLSRSARLTVTSDVAPAFTAQPADAAVVEGATAAFTVAVAGSPTPTIQWQTSAPGSATWADVPGASGASYTTPAATLQQNGTRFRAVATSAAGSAASDTAQLAVDPGPIAIVSQPVSTTVVEGASAAFTVVASGKPPLTYGWERVVFVPGGAQTTYAGTGPRLVFASASPADEGDYYVGIHDRTGAYQASQVVTLTVEPRVVPLPPVITVQPVALSVPAGAPAAFAVDATGSAPLAYQWSKDGAPILGATAAVLAISSAAAGDAGSYAVTVSNGVSPDAISVPAALAVLAGPAIATQPAPVTVLAGEAAAFGVSATGAGLSYQWLRSGVAIPGATGASYTTPPTSASDTGAVFSAVVWNGSGTVVSAGAMLTVVVAPPPAIASVTPAAGPTSGGTPIAIAGSGFRAGAAVTIGGAPATAVAWVSATSITAVTPPGAAGPADVRVANPDAQSAVAAGAFTYEQATLSVASASPAGGSSGNAASATTVEVAFSAPLDCARAGPASLQVFEGAAAVAGAASCVGSTLTFQPAVALPTSTALRGHVDSAVQSLAGAPLGSPYDWTFGMAPWTRQVGSPAWDAARKVIVGRAGEVHVVAQTQGGVDGNALAGILDLLAVKYASSGAKLWTRQLGVAGAITLANGGAVDAAGNLYVVGSTSGNLDGNTVSGPSDVLVVKYDAAGTKLWTRLYGTATADQARAAAVDPAGNLYVAGFTDGGLHGNAGAGGSDLFLMKLDPSGAVLWTRQLGSPQGDQAQAVALDGAGNVYVSGTTQGPLDGNTAGGPTTTVDGFLVKYGADGTKQWTRQLGTAADEFTNALAVDAAGSAYVGGATYGGLDGHVNAGPSGTGDAFVVKYDAAGVRQWTWQAGSAATDGVNGLTVDPAGGVFGAGGTNGVVEAGATNGGGTNQLVFALDAGGSLRWLHQRQSVAGANDNAISVAVDPAGDLFVVGVTDGGFEGVAVAGSIDVYAVKLRADGWRR